MFKLVVLLLLWTSRCGDCESVISDKSGLGGAVGAPPSAAAAATRAGDVWPEVLAAAILNGLKHPFQQTPERLNLESSPIVSFFATVIKVYNDVVYSQFHREYEVSDGAARAVNPKEEVEMINAGQVPPCAGSACYGNSGSPTKSICSPAPELDPDRGCAPSSPASPAAPADDSSPPRYIVRVPHQCPDGYRSHRGICHLVW